MPKQRYDNEARSGALQRAKKKVSELVKKGYRLNPGKASDYYNQQVERARRDRWAKK
jgi:CRISPR/Cas system-associated endonuclease Cas3-HD